MSQYPETIDLTKLDEALEADVNDRDDQDWHLIELAAEKWLAKEKGSARTEPFPKGATPENVAL